jgi:Mrp family chromosome partitioning ATPase
MQAAVEKGAWPLMRGGNGSAQNPSDLPIPTPIIYSRTRSIVLPAARMKEKRVISSIEPGPFSDAYKILRTGVLQRMRQNGWRSLGITSPGAGEGKSLTAVNLAVGLAMMPNQTVLLVDADLHDPAVHTFFGLEGDRGLIDHLLYQTPLAGLLVHPGIERFVLLPGGRPVAGSSELLNSVSMRALAGELTRRYLSRMVIFDLPPLLNTDAVLAFAPLVDAILLVVEAGETQVEGVERSLTLLRSLPIIGTVLNKG